MLEVLGAARVLEHSVDGDELCDDQLAHGSLLSLDALAP
jgi:hypothetical protein